MTKTLFLSSFSFTLDQTPVPEGVPEIRKPVIRGVSRMNPTANPSSFFLAVAHGLPETQQHRTARGFWLKKSGIIGQRLSSPSSTLICTLSGKNRM
jgi:hypothetical protein